MTGVARWAIARGLPYLLLGLSLACAGAAADRSPLRIPVQVWIVSDMRIEKTTQMLDSWVSDEDVRREIQPALNAIWRPAAIAFDLQVASVPQQAHPRQEKLLRDVANARRDARGKADPERIRKLSKLLPVTRERSGVINVYLVPYLGEASQGHAQRKSGRVFIGQWSDKYAGSAGQAYRMSLVEPLPFRRGSLARTLAHELGHVLGLAHPDKSSQTVFHRLMGGRRPGYTLTDEEILVARQYAASWRGLSVDRPY